MDRYYKPNLTQINNVPSGAMTSSGFTWSANLPVGPAYRYLDIITTMTAAGGATLASVSDFMNLVTISINSKPFRMFLGSEAHDVYTRYGSNYGAVVFKSTGAGNTLYPVLSGTSLAAPAANGQGTCVLRIYFEEPWRKNWTAASARKLTTQWPAATQGGPAQTISSLQIQCQVNQTANNTAATGISVYIQAGTDKSVGIVTAQGTPVTNSLKWYRFPSFTYSASGDQQVQNVVPYNKGQQLAILEEMDFFAQSTGDDIDRVQVNSDGDVNIDCTPALNSLDLVRHGFNPLYNLDEFAVVFDANDDVTDGKVLSTPTGQFINNFIVTATLVQASGANKSYVIISQVFGPLD
jgi:hypothetical protein